MTTLSRRPSADAGAGSRERSLVTWLLVAMVVWLPLQTPVTMVLHQYGGWSVGAVRALVLAKDVIAVGAIALLLARHYRHVRWHWFDVCALAFLGLLAFYTLGSSLGPNAPSLNASLAGVRQFALPVQIYALGRLAVASGVRLGAFIRPFVVVSAVAAAFTVLAYVLLPIDFWSSSLNLVSYVREVQGNPRALSLWDISVVGTYGQASGQLIARATGPFTHPVGTGAYFVLPFALAATALLFGIARRRVRPMWGLAAGLFLVAILFTISRGSWAAAGVALVLAGIALRQIRLALLACAVFAAVVWMVPPFSVSLRSAVDGSDGSATMHRQAVEDGIETVTENPFGMGPGRSDFVFGQTFGGGAAEGTLLENTYLGVYVAAGPLGFAAFAAWLAGVAASLWPGRGFRRYHWPHVAMLVALIGLAVASLTSATLLRFTTGASLWILVGLVVGHLPAHRGRLPFVDRVRGRRPRRLAPAARPVPSAMTAGRPNRIEER